MIELRVDEYCHGCNHFTPVVKDLYADGYLMHQIVRCEYWRKCDTIADRIRKQLEKEKENKND